MPLNAPPDLLIFDCDGVLVDSEGPMHEVLHQELCDFGIEISFADCLNLFKGKSIEDLIATAEGLGADLPDGWRVAFYKRVHARLAQGVAMMPGAKAFIAELQSRRIPFCVASNGSETKMQLLLSQHGMWDLFKDVCFSAQTFGRGKPDPGLLLHTLRRMGNPQRLVVIEDSATGVLSARAAQIPCLVLSDDEKLNASQDHGTPVFSNFGEISAFLF